VSGGGCALTPFAFSVQRAVSRIDSDSVVRWRFIPPDVSGAQSGRQKQQTPQTAGAGGVWE